jgi:hypothetical protein
MMRSSYKDILIFCLTVGRVGGDTYAAEVLRVADLGAELRGKPV